MELGNKGKFPPRVDRPRSLWMLIPLAFIPARGWYGKTGVLQVWVR